jgi:hypothetical protein
MVLNIFSENLQILFYFNPAILILIFKFAGLNDALCLQGNIYL